MGRPGLVSRKRREPALLVPCRGRVIDTRRERVPDLACAGLRTVLIPLTGDLPRVVLGLSVALALIGNLWNPVAARARGTV